ncbi:site-specific integrase, partial [Vibrio anguillarum]
MLRRSDPEKTFNIGERWHLTPHQLRRSLAYYLVGMQLADYPQLKQQFSHYSIAMTMYYARNASSFRKMYHD